MNKKKMFNLIADLCSDAIHLSRQSTEQNAIEAAFRCFDTAVDALEYAAARKTTAELEKSAEVYEQAQQQYEKAEAQKKQNAAQRARYEQQETWETRLAELKESCEEQRHKMEQSMDDRAIVRTIGHQMADNLDQTTKIIQQRIEQLSATEEMVNRNQTEILKLQQVQQDILRHFTQLTAYETGGK